MNTYEILYREEKKKREQTEAQLNIIKGEYEHLKSIHEILLHRLKIIVEGGEKR